jgi:hypothetical protein
MGIGTSTIPRSQRLTALAVMVSGQALGSGQLVEPLGLFLLRPALGVPEIG